MAKLKTKRLKDGSWWKVAADGVIQKAGTQPLQAYLDRGQAKLAEWVALQTIFKVCIEEGVRSRSLGGDRQKQRNS